MVVVMVLTWDLLHQPNCYDCKDAVTYVTSGLIDGNNMVLSYLNKAITAKPTALDGRCDCYLSEGLCPRASFVLHRRR